MAEGGALRMLPSLNSLQQYGFSLSFLLEWWPQSSLWPSEVQPWAATIHAGACAAADGWRFRHDNRRSLPIVPEALLAFGLTFPGNTADGNGNGGC